MSWGDGGDIEIAGENIISRMTNTNEGSNQHAEQLVERRVGSIVDHVGCPKEEVGIGKGVVCSAKIKIQDHHVVECVTM